MRIIMYTGLSGKFFICTERRSAVSPCQSTTTFPIAALGRSGAQIAGGVLIANELGSLNLPMDTMLTLAAIFEGHPDNVTAAFLGGLTISTFDGKILRTRSIHPSLSL